MVRIAIAILSLQLSACDRFISAAMVFAPNRGDDVAAKSSSPATLKFLGIDHEMRVEVGPPPASLRLWVIEPQAAGQSSQAEPRGTLLVLHGYRASSMWIRGMGKGFAQSGYRVVMVDARGHGRSSGQYMTYGVVESRDASQVIDALERQGLVAGKLGVWGISMGGATAIQLAARDSRVSAVVAVAPYTTMRDVVPGVVRLLMPVYGWFLSDETIRRQVDAAGERAGFDPDEADTLAAMRRVQVPTLIVHGGGDWIVPPNHGRRLHEANPEHTTFVELCCTGHIAAHFSGAVERQSVKWFTAHLPNDHK